MNSKQQDALLAAVQLLEENGGVKQPTTAKSLEGKWTLLYTTKQGTQSPIQNTFIGVDAFTVYQEIQLTEATPRVNNIVDFGTVGYLKVEAEASIESRPLDGFTPRVGEGMPLFGKSSNYPAAKPDSRIDFQFDTAAFYFSFLPFPIPYPVPFRILGDERKGWLDVTYLSDDSSLRLSRGNKGTLFILSKDVPREDVLQQLQDAIAEGDDDAALVLVGRLSRCSPVEAPARSELASAEWRLIWSQQSKSASALQKFGTSQALVFQNIDAAAGTAQNVVSFGGGFARLQADATCEAASDTRTNIVFTSVTISLGPFTFPLPRETRTKSGTLPGYVDWLYLDENIRITRGSKGSLFVHRRDKMGPEMGVFPSEVQPETPAVIEAETQPVLEE
ncbi:MAG: hypothetical protein WDW38_001582 [Sanguina aurantia]